MATAQLIGTGPEGPGHHLAIRDSTDITATASDTSPPTPTTPTRPIVPDASIPQTQRRSSRTRKPTERALNTDEGSDIEIEGDGQSTETAPKPKAKRGRPPIAQKAQQAHTATDDPTAANVQLVRLVEAMMGRYEKKIEELVKVIQMHKNQTEKLVKIGQMNENKIEELVERYEHKISELLEIGQKNADRIVALEAQNQRLMELVKNSANEQVKMTRSWAQVVTGTGPVSKASPSTPASRPSLATTSINPNSSASQASNLSPSAVLIDLNRTNERTRDFAQLKDKVNEALKKHEATKEVVCTGIQRRVGGEDQVKLTFGSEEMAKTARQHDQWCKEARFEEARMLGEQWYPVKVDRVHRATLSPDGAVTVSQAAMEAVAQENRVRIERIRWLSKASDKVYGSVVMFFTHQHEADMLLARGVMDVGGEMAYTRRYERRQAPMRCYKCHQYGHQAARCKASSAVCGRCAQSGHTAPECTSASAKCAACQGPHPATDRVCPKYMELLRRFNPVERHG